MGGKAASDGRHGERAAHVPLEGHVELARVAQLEPARHRLVHAHHAHVERRLHLQARVWQHGAEYDAEGLLELDLGELHIVGVLLALDRPKRDRQRERCARAQRDHLGERKCREVLGCWHSLF